jgi:hypothetical protein
LPPDNSPQSPTPAGNSAATSLKSCGILAALSITLPLAQSGNRPEQNNPAIFSSFWKNQTFPLNKCYFMR